MGWFGSGAYVKADQKFDYFNLEDFKSRTCFTPISFGYLQITILFSIFLYALDIYVAVNLLVHDTWSKEITSWIPLQVAKYIFLICILMSLVMLAYEWLRAFRVIRRRGVAENYLDPIAARAQTLGRKGWRKFNLFAHLTKSKKGTDYVAFYAYFSFQRWYRTIFADGPRQAVNGATVVWLVRQKIVPGDEHPIQKGNTGFTQFFANIGTLADTNRNQAFVLCSMACSLVIWLFFMINLIIAILLYLFFLWHYIPSSDGSLYKFCKRKIDSRLSKIADEITRKAQEKEEAKMRKKEKAAKKSEKEPVPGIQRAPALADAPKDSDKLSDMPGLSRTTTTNTFSSDIQTPSSAFSKGPDFPDLTRSPYKNFGDNGPPTMSSAQFSMHSNASYNSNAPLLRNGSSMGHTDSYFDQRPGTADYDTGTPYSAHSHEMLPYPRSNNMYPGPTAPMPAYSSPLGQRGYDERSASVPPQMGRYTPGPQSALSGPGTPMSAPPMRQMSLERIDTNVGPYAHHSREPSDPLDSYFGDEEPIVPASHLSEEHGRSTPASGYPSGHPSNEFGRSTPTSGHPSGRPSYEAERNPPYSNSRAPSRTSQRSQGGPASGRSTPHSRGDPPRPPSAAPSGAGRDNYNPPPHMRQPSDPPRRPSPPGSFNQTSFQPRPPMRTMTAPIPQHEPAFARPGTAPPPQHQNDFYEPQSQAPMPYSQNNEQSFRPGPPRRVGTAPIGMGGYGPPAPSPYRGPPGPAGQGGYRGPPPPRSGTADPYGPRRGPPPQQRPGPGQMGGGGWQQQGGGQYRY